MTFEQIAIFAILGGALALFVWDRLRYDLVAMLALLAALACGVVKPEEAFRGFSDDIVIIIASALVISAAIAKSGIAEAALRPVAGWMRSSEMQIVVLATIVAVLSAFMKNIGALAIMMPIAFQLAKRNGTPVARVLMPMSFAALLGGMMTLIGTSPNIIVSKMRQEMLGEPYAMFDFLPVAAVLTVLGIAFLTFGWRLLPKREGGGGKEAFSDDNYQTEVLLPEKNALVGKTVADLEALGEGDLSVAAIIREGARRYVPRGHWTLFAGDILVVQCDATVLEKIVGDANLEVVNDREVPEEDKDAKSDLAVMEAVIPPDSILVGVTVEQLRLRDRYGINLLSLSRRGAPVRTRLQRARLQAGDVIVLRGPEKNVADAPSALGCLPLAERNLRLGERRHRYRAALILAVAMAAAASGTVSVAVAFFAAAVAILAVGALTLKEAYQVIEWPILILLGALIPVSDALRTTGGAELIAAGLSVVANQIPPIAAVGLVLVAAMAVTPFLNNAATVLVMAPIGASLAERLGLNPDPFLMAVAVGAASDFLTPIGHQCNTLVMGPGCYRFNDYWRLGLPLSVLVALLGTALIAFVWPLG
ncbi:MAG TPA: SLC13 family permease [Alphaproteobacteria bacterium]|nr:SLC13 family permease [Alphaproteobacteria bacterium]